MPETKGITLTSNEAALLFDLSRPSFYDFAVRHDIKNVAPFNGARKHQARLYAFDDIARVYQEVYHERLNYLILESLLMDLMRRRKERGAKRAS